jgi:signal transduction histidine kinase
MRTAASVTVWASAAAIAGVAASILIGGPPLLVVAVPALAAAAAGLLGRGRRAAERSCAAAVAGAAGCLAATAVVLITLGRPTGAERAGAIAGITAGAVGSVVAARVLRRGPVVAGALPGQRDALDTVAARVTQALPVDELLQQVVDALRHAPHHRAVELWRTHDDVLALAHCAPLVDRAPVVLRDPVVTSSDRSSVNGGAWLRTWFPELASEGSDSGLDRVAPLVAHGEVLGLIVLRREAHDAPFGPGDDDRLGRIQRPVSIALDQARLHDALEASVDELHHRNDELQASRARLVSAADAERRRLERDLHDGAQSQLTALRVQIQLARTLAARDPARTSELLAALEADLGAAADELRRLSHGIVPPLLVTDGLGDALRVAASRSPVDVTVASWHPRRFASEIEAAVYFCVSEALQNVAKHAGPGARTTVRLSHTPEHLTFEVLDDGAGSNGAGSNGAGSNGAGSSPGHGVVNMADRVGALGGTLRVGSGGEGGFVVRGQIPLAASLPEADDSVR